MGKNPLFQSTSAKPSSARARLRALPVVFQGADSMNRAPRQRRSDHSEGGEAVHVESEGTWIFSYADMITILMMFFILLLSISNVSPEKFEKLQQALKDTKESQGKNPEVMKDVPTGITVAEIPVETMARKAAETGGDRHAQILAMVKMLLDSVNKKYIEKEQQSASSFDRMKQEMETLAKAIEGASLAVRPRVISVTVPSEELFVGRSSVLRASAKAFVERLYEAFRKVEPIPHIEISAHASAAELNPVDGKTPQPDGEDAGLRLTTEQAYRVLQLLVKSGAESRYLNVAAYGGMQPLVTESEENSISSRRNSRIVITLTRRMQEESR